MLDNPVREALEELLDYLEQVETQSAAVFAFLRESKVANDKKLAPYLEQAANATSVKSTAIRARFDYLFTKDDAKPATEVNPGSADNQAVERAAKPQAEEQSRQKTEPAQESKSSHQAQPGQSAQSETQAQSGIQKESSPKTEPTQEWESERQPQPEKESKEAA